MALGSLNQPNQCVHNPACNDDLVAAGGLVGGDRAGYRHQGPAEVAGVTGGVGGAAAAAGLDNQGAGGEGGGDSVPCEEPQARHDLAGRPFADEQALGGDRIEQAGVTGRVGLVHAAGQHGDRRTVGGQCAAVLGECSPTVTAAVLPTPLYRPTA